MCIMRGVYNSPHSACALYIEAATSIIDDVAFQIEAATAYIEDAAARAEDVEAHKEDAIDCAQDATAHIVPLQHAQRLRQPT